MLAFIGATAANHTDGFMTVTKLVFIVNGLHLLFSHGLNIYLTNFE